MLTRQARIEARITPKRKRLFDRVEHTTIELSERSQRAFVEALRNPPEPNAALRAAAKAYSKMK